MTLGFTVKGPRSPLFAGRPSAVKAAGTVTQALLPAPPSLHLDRVCGDVSHSAASVSANPG